MRVSLEHFARFHDPSVVVFQQLVSRRAEIGGPTSERNRRHARFGVEFETDTSERLARQRVAQLISTVMNLESAHAHYTNVRFYRPPRPGSSRKMEVYHEESA